MQLGSFARHSIKKSDSVEQAHQLRFRIELSGATSQVDDVRCSASTSSERVVETMGNHDYREELVQEIPEIHAIYPSAALLSGTFSTSTRSDSLAEEAAPDVYAWTELRASHPQVGA
uniref:Uncharacterized protein n=1 Tax=Noctiluca scintillans TaxID=2966 RepID=A0A7S0ZQ12_NOCSC